MDRRDVESGGRLHDPDRRLHELLRDAHGGTARSHGHEQVAGPDAQDGRTSEVDRQSRDRFEIDVDPCNLVETTPRLRELDV